MFAHGTGGTLTVKSITWQHLKYNGKVAFKYLGHHAIVFNPEWNLYAIMQDGCCQFMGSVSECLELATTVVLDYYANRITPSWEIN